MVELFHAEDIPCHVFKAFDPDTSMPKLHFQGNVVDEIPIAMKENLAMDGYKKYMKEKYGWPETTWEQIDWWSFQSAMQSHPGKLVSLRKYMHSWLPVVNLVKHYGPD